MHAFLETADAFAQALHDFWNFFAAEQKHHDGQDYQPMKWAELSHDVPAFRVACRLEDGDKEYDSMAGL